MESKFIVNSSETTDNEPEIRPHNISVQKVGPNINEGIKNKNYAIN